MRLFNLIVLVFVGICCIHSGVSAQNTTQPFDHSLFDSLLRKGVKDGVVDYGVFAQHYQDLQTYLAQLTSAPFRSLPRGEQLAMAINAYNAHCINGVLKEGKIKSVKEVWYFFKKTKFNLGGEEMNLDSLEHEVLRKMGEPRIHFAIVCASKSCPKLADHAYQAATLNEDLNRAARDFFHDSSKNRLDHEKSIYYMNAIMNWFKEDFTTKAPSVIQFAAPHLPPADREYLTKNSAKIEFLEYDWSLNGHF